MEYPVDDLVESTPTPQRNLYQKYKLEEEIDRLAYHYNVPSEFFVIITGGLWNTYSCSIFDSGNTQTMTQAQERKLDEFARLMNLRPGMRILDVGCGWGGPLVYLCKRYGVTGVGVTVTEEQIPFAINRSLKYGTNAEFILSHWETFSSDRRFDAIFTDEVVVHINNLDLFFDKCHALLKPHGKIVNKELHLTDERYRDWSDALGVHVNKVYGFTGNYRLLGEEVESASKAGFALKENVQIPMSNYTHTVQHHWIRNLLDNKLLLSELTSAKHVEDFYKYLRCTLVSFRKQVFEQNILAFYKV